MFKSQRTLLIKCLTWGLVLGWASQAEAQQKLPLNDLSAFTNKAGNWSIVGDATVDITQPNVLNTTPGKGVLACIHKQGTYGPDYELLTKLQHGDLDIEMDYMLAKGSNSGVYLQGNYEVQLFDSWGNKNPKYSDNGGIYHRWNTSQPKGQEGYEGYAPRVNASKAPGLWQHIAISYQAPRFDKDGKKIANAVFLKITLNGTTIHENVEVSGPTRGALSETDVPMGPLRIQGDHGSLAIKNIVISNFDKKPAAISNVKYNTYYGQFENDVALSSLKADESGSAESLSWDVSKKDNNYINHYTATINAPTQGEYTFRLLAAGNSYLKIDGRDLMAIERHNSDDPRTATINLNAGDHKMELYVNKRDGWMKNAMALMVSGPGFREVPFQSANSMLGGGGSDPILVDADDNTVLRSFMDIQPSNGKRQRVVHAISVGSPTGLHYTYDLEKGAIFQVWRGGFLDATPMWEDRGDGSSRPRGTVTLLGDVPLLAKTSGTWPTDTTGSRYRPKGYELDADDVPTFMYEAFGTTVSDKTSIVDGKYFSREIKTGQPVSGLMARLAEGKSIEKISDGLYAVDDKDYYVQLPAGSATPEIKKANGGASLMMPMEKGDLKYSILF